MDTSAAASDADLTNDQLHLIDKLKQGNPYRPWFAARIFSLFKQVREWFQSSECTSRGWPTATIEYLKRRVRFGEHLFIIAMCKTAVWLTQRIVLKDRELPEPELLAWSGRLKQYMSELMQCSIWKQLDSRKDPFVLIMSKAIPQRCQIREMGDTTLSRFAVNEEFATSFCQWISCALLGMYGHSLTCLSIPRLMEFFTMSMNRDRLYLFHQWLLKRQPLLSIFVAREYMIDLVPDQPALLSAMRSTFNWDRFVTVCIQVSAQVRQLIDHYGWSCLFVNETLPVPNMDSATDRASSRSKNTQQSTQQQHGHTGEFYWFPSISEAPSKGHMVCIKNDSQIVQVVKVASTRTLDTFTVRTAKNVEVTGVRVSNMTGVPGKTAGWTCCQSTDPRPRGCSRPQIVVDRKDMPSWALVLQPADNEFETLQVFLDRLAPIWKQFEYQIIPRDYPGLVRFMCSVRLLRNPSKKGAGKSKEADDLAVLRFAQKQLQPCFYSREGLLFRDLVKSCMNKVPPTTIRPYPGLSTEDMTDHGITRRHAKTLSMWLDRVANLHEDEAIQLLRAFGISEYALHKLMHIKQSYEARDREYGRKPVVSMLRALKFEQPYSYALIHSFFFLWSRVQDFWVADLPLHYVENQIVAIRKRFRLKETDPIPICATYVYLCTMCDHIYSIYTDEKQCSDQETCLDSRECFGYNDPVHNLETGDLYCTRDNVIAHNDFKEVKLVRVLALGKIIYFRDMCIMLCPRCNIVMILDPQKNMYDELGYSCSWCTLCYREPEKAAQRIIMTRRKKKKRQAADD